eukprot:TRINITY_DN12604_c0_g1_i1.p1 TRINITY_DN12604_c0_g1~~TRINITY_DN12604_c0_g1_i1.p1  ORF type:complete len:645 (-),score=116.96 TRINITY_DN12604_c0_g1_i1:147-2081(-)
MADKIREFQEKMLIELEEWEERGLFTKDEIKAIIKRRTDYEYKLVSFQVDKVDYLRYIEYEDTLDSLLKTRMRRDGFKRTKEEEPYHNYCVTRILNIFRRCTSRLRSKGIYLQFIEYCRKIHNTDLLRSIFSSAIQAFPNVAEFWVSAAKFEIKQNKNIVASRTIMQLALRFTPNSQELWLQFYILELMYWRKMMRRLSKDNLEALKPKEGQIDLAKVLPKGKEEDKPNPHVETYSVSGDPVKDIKKNIVVSPFFLCAIPIAIYKNATKALPSLLTLRLKFLEIARRFKADRLTDFVCASILSDFPLDERAIAAVAEWSLKAEGKYKKAGYKKACEVYALSISTGDHPHIWKAYTHFLISHLKQIPCGTDCERFVTKKLLEIFAEAPADPELIVQWTNCLLSVGKSETALEVALSGVKKFPGSALMWSKKIEMDVKAGKSATAIIADYKTAIKKIHPPSPTFYLNYIRWLVICDNTHKEENKLSEEDDEHLFDGTDKATAIYKISIECVESLSATLKSEAFGSFKQSLLDIINIHYGIQYARKFIKQTISLPPNSIQYYIHCVSIEESQPKSSFDLTSIRGIYEKGIQSFGTQPESEELWLRYIKMESTKLQMERASTLYWRAKQSLPDPESFIVKYQEMKPSL